VRAGICAATCIAAIVSLHAYWLQGAVAMPAQRGLELLDKTGRALPIEDTCWWWGTRWQYGWRGYAWYPCFDWTKPFPTTVTPEAVPEDALSARKCVQKWQDQSGNWHSRQTC